METISYKFTLAEVLLEVDNILSNHDWALNVVLNPLQASDALLTCVPDPEIWVKTFFNLLQC